MAVHDQRSRMSILTEDVLLCVAADSKIVAPLSDIISALAALVKISGMTQLIDLKKKAWLRHLRVNWMELAKAAAIIGVCTALAAPFAQFVHPRNLILIYLIGSIIIAKRYSTIVAFLSCVLAVLIYDFLYVRPFFSLIPADKEYFFTLCGMFTVSLLISTMASMLKQSAEKAAERELIARTINQLNRAIMGARTTAGLVDAGASQISDSLGLRAEIQLASANSAINLNSSSKTGSGSDSSSASSSGSNSNSSSSTMISSGASTANSAGSVNSLIMGLEPDTLVVRLQSAHNELGTLILRKRGNKVPSSVDLNLIQAVADQISLGLERTSVFESAEKTRLQVESVRLRNALLSSVSHDLRTPLASIMGAASSILTDAQLVLPTQHQELVQSIYNEADRLAKFLKNLLDMTRIESGAIQLKKEWQSLEESVGVAFGRLRKQLEPFKIKTKIPHDLPLLLYDEQLVDQVLFNLLDNATKYAPAGSDITVSCTATAEGIATSVANLGCELPMGDEQKIFEKFYRGEAAPTAYGAGLGLTICRGILQAHGGRIWAERFGDTGISICFSIPQTGEPPVMIPENEES